MIAVVSVGGGFLMSWGVMQHRVKALEGKVDDLVKELRASTDRLLQTHQRFDDEISKLEKHVAVLYDRSARTAEPRRPSYEPPSSVPPTRARKKDEDT